MVWVLLSLGAAVCTSLVTVFTKIGVKDVNSNFATFFRTGIVIICCVVMCLISGSFTSVPSFTWQNYLFLGLSGLATGFSWLCYFRALKLGDVNKVAPIDKSSFILTSLLFLIFFFDDTTDGGSALTISMLCVSMALMLAGTLLMSCGHSVGRTEGKSWIFYAVLSAVFASLVSLFIKMGLKGIPGNLGTLFRTIIVFFFAGAIVLVKGDYRGASKISAKSWVFLALSGVATGFAWLMEYEALNYTGANPVVVNAIGKLAILLTMAFSFLFLKEKFSVKTLFGLFLLVVGIVLIVIFGL